MKSILVFYQIVLLSLFSTYLYGQEETITTYMHGYVINETFGLPVPNVEIYTWTNSSEKLLTDKNGHYSGLAVKWQFIYSLQTWVSEKIYAEKANYEWSDPIEQYYILEDDDPNSYNMDVNFLGAKNCSPIDNNKRVLLEDIPYEGTISPNVIWGTPSFYEKFDDETFFNENWHLDLFCDRGNCLHKINSDNSILDETWNPGGTKGEGRLRILTKKEENPGFCGEKCYGYSSGEIFSRDGNALKKYSHGLFEARYKAPRGKGVHSGFWMYGHNEQIGCGNEIDIVETGSYTNSAVVDFGSNIWIYNECQTLPDDESIGHSQHQFLSTEISDALDEDFYTYSFEWTPYDLTWFINGIEFYSIAGCDCIEGIYNPSDIADLAITIGVQVDAWNAPDQFPLEVYTDIDYIKVYQKKLGQYKKKPTIIGPDSANVGESCIFKVESNKTDTYEWQVINGTLTGISYPPNTISAKIKDDKRTMYLQVIATDYLGKKSTRQHKVTNRLNSDFRIAYLYGESCYINNDNYKITQSFDPVLKTGYTHDWELFELDVNGNKIQPPVFTGTNVNWFAIPWGEDAVKIFEPFTNYRMEHTISGGALNLPESSTSKDFYTRLSNNFNIELDEEEETTIKVSNILSAASSCGDNVRSTFVLFQQDSTNCDGTIGVNPMYITHEIVFNEEEVIFENLAANTYYTVQLICDDYINDYIPQNFLIPQSYTKSIRTGGADKGGEKSSAMIEPTEIDNINIYPNPASDIIYFNIASSFSEGVKTLKIFDVRGCKVKEQSFNGYSSKIEISDLSKGMYLMHIHGDNINLIKKVFKQ